MHDAVGDLDHPRLDAELLAPHPVRKDADAGPERGEAQALERHVDDLDAEHVAGLGAADLDRAGGPVDEGDGDVRWRQLLADMGDDAVVDVDGALDLEGLARCHPGDEGIVGRERILDVAVLGHDLGHLEASSWFRFGLARG